MSPWDNFNIDIGWCCALRKARDHSIKALPCQGASRCKTAVSPLCDNDFIPAGADWRRRTGDPINNPANIGGSGWRTPAVVLACASLILMLSLGTRHGFGLFLQPMTLDLSWNRQTFAFAIALQNLIWGCAQPFAGMIADKFGAARVVVAGGLFYALGLLLMAYSSTGLAFDLSAGILVGLGLSGSGFGVVMGVVGRAAPPEKRSAALGLVGAAGSFGQFAMLPYEQFLIGHFGWLQALLFLALSSLLIIPLASALAGSHRAAHISDQSLSPGRTDLWRQISIDAVQHCVPRSSDRKLPRCLVRRVHV